MNSIQANGIKLAYDSYGNKHNETILLIAGLGTQMIRWTDSFCKQLAMQGFRVIRFDNRDAGYSTHFSEYPALDFEALAAALMSGQRPAVPYTLDDMCQDVIHFMDALGIQRAHIVGRSMGGMIAQLIASDYPERVLSLTSIMSSSGNPTLPPASEDTMELMTRPVPDPFENEAAFLAHSLTFAKRIAGTGYPFDEAAHQALVLEEAHRAYDPSSTGRQIAAIALSGDRRPRLAMIQTPSLVIHGTDDPLFVPACGEDTATSIPGAEWMLIPGMGHDLPQQLYTVIIDAIVRIARRDKSAL